MLYLESYNFHHLQMNRVTYLGLYGLFQF